MPSLRGTDGKITVSRGDIITVRAQGIAVTGVVATVSHCSDGWYIEIDEANVPGGWSYWKQPCDGGRITMLNGKVVEQ